MEIYNADTGQLETIQDREMLHEAVLRGTHGFKKGTLVKGSYQGQFQELPAENVYEAAKLGFKPYTSNDLKVREAVEANKGIVGDLKVGILQLLDEGLTFGVAEEIMLKKMSPLQRETWEAIKQDHQAANTIGGVVGAFNPLGAPAKLGVKAGQVVQKAVTNKIKTAVAGTTTSKARKIAADIVGKAGGSAAEGMVYASPHALTEATLGDPSQAAEILMAGGLVGGVFGAAGGFSGQLAKIPVKAYENTKDLMRQVGVTSADVAGKVTEGVTGMRQETIEHYIKHRERVNQARPMSELKDEIDENVTKLKAEVDDLQLDMKVMNREQAKDDLVAELIDELEGTKAWNTEMSIKAEDALAASTREIPVVRLNNAIDRLLDKVKIKGKDKYVTELKPTGKLDKDGNEIMKKITKKVKNEKPISATSKKIYNELTGLKKDLKGLFGDSVPLTEARHILKDIRENLDYNPLAGGYSSYHDRVMKEFAKEMSQAIKGYSDEYAQIMEEMHKRISDVEPIVKAFGSEKLAKAKLSAILKGTPASELNYTLLKRYSEATGSNFAERVQEELNRRARVVSDYEAKKAIFDQVKRLTPNRTQSALNNQGFKKPNIEDTKAIENYDRLFGTNLAQEIKDRSVLDAFDKDYTRGSKRVNLGGAIGWALGGGAGAAVGGLAGAVVDAHGGKIVKSLIDRVDKDALPVLAKQLNTFGKKLEEIPKIIERMASGVDRKTKRTRALGKYGVVRALSPETAQEKKETRKVKLKRYNDIKKKTERWVGDPGALSESIAGITGNIEAFGAPELAGELSLKLTQGVMYLSDSLPKPPRINSMFAPGYEWEPSDQELEHFEQKLEVIEDPNVVFEELEAGTLTKYHMDALLNVYPLAYELMKDKIIEASTDLKKPIRYTDRLKLGLLIGAPLDQSVRNISFYQPATEGEEDQGGSTSKAVNIPGSTPTDIDRVTLA